MFASYLERPRIPATEEEIIEEAKKLLIIAFKFILVLSPFIFKGVSYLL